MVFGRLSLFLTNFQNWLRHLWKVFYMRMIDRYTYQKRSWCGGLDGYLLWFYNISKWYSEENLSNSNNVWQTTIFRRFKSMNLLLMMILLRKSTTRICLNIIIFLVTIFWTICDLNKVLIKYKRLHTFLLMSDFWVEFFLNFRHGCCLSVVFAAFL